MKSRLKNKKILLVVLAALLLFTAGAGAWVLSQKDKSTELAPGEINYDPPTNAEKKETEQFKKDLVEKTNNPSNNPSSENINVTMTYLGYENDQVRATGFIAGIFEEGGTCTLTLTKGTLKATGTSAGIQDVNKTTCPSISIDKGQLENGEWSGVLTYASPPGSSSSGSSPARTINVP
ncbi:MAG TPA: hypothetical protein VD947_00605 [Patescibacteria group bacterium]|nr:hypothetical protein [Patescibacteria group bacterium]